MIIKMKKDNVKEIIKKAMMELRDIDRKMDAKLVAIMGGSKENWLDSEKAVEGY